MRACLPVKSPGRGGWVAWSKGEVREGLGGEGKKEGRREREKKRKKKKKKLVIFFFVTKEILGLP